MFLPDSCFILVKLATDRIKLLKVRLIKPTGGCNVEQLKNACRSESKFSRRKSLQQRMVQQTNWKLIYDALVTAHETGGKRGQTGNG